LLVLGRFEGRVPAEAENEDGTVQVRFHDLAGADLEPVLEHVEQVRAETAAARHGDWKPWFPVIDYDRCTNCMQCLSFCLFGVYGVDGEQSIQVQNNDQCKTNCPACSRVCPEAAIMFPKYKAGPINGDVVSQADLQREKMKVDISALLGGDVYQMLRERSDKAKSRFSKERDSDKALKERQKCLVKLQEAGDIPAEVLMSLPSPEEIQKRAREAAAKAQSVLDQRKPS
jgi:Pyruvate/2-oxoacid:ferredoxin oxidoreductase delta subunit